MAPRIIMSTYAPVKKRGLTGLQEEGDAHEGGRAMDVRELIHALLNYDMNQQVEMEYSLDEFPDVIVDVRGLRATENGYVVLSRYLQKEEA